MTSHCMRQLSCCLLAIRTHRGRRPLHDNHRSRGATCEDTDKIVMTRGQLLAPFSMSQAACFQLNFFPNSRRSADH